MSSPNAIGKEKLTVSSTAIGFAAIADKASAALVSVETANIRYWADGSTPTATDGMPVEAGDQFLVNANLSAFRAIATGSDATLQIIYLDGPVTPGKTTVGAVTVETGDIEIGAVEIGADELGAGEIGAGEIGADTTFFAYAPIRMVIKYFFQVFSCDFHFHALNKIARTRADETSGGRDATAPVVLMRAECVFGFIAVSLAFSFQLNCA